MNSNQPNQSNRMDTQQFASSSQAGSNGNDAPGGTQLTRADKRAKPGLRPLSEVRTGNLPQHQAGGSVMSLLGMYLGGIANGFSKSDIPEMERDPDVSLGLEYVFTPILNAKITVIGQGEEQIQAQDIFDRFWQHDLECFKDMFTHGHCPAEVKYKEPSPEEVEMVAGGGGGGGANPVGGNPPGGTPGTTIDKPRLDYDGMIVLNPDECEPYVNDGKLAYIKAFNKIILEGYTDKRPAKGFWLTNDPKYNAFEGKSILPGCWLFWRIKIGMPDSAVEILMKAFYKCAFSGNMVLFPNEDISDEDGNIYDSRAEAEWYAENLKAGSNVAMPSEVNEGGKPKWDIKSYGGQPVDVTKMLPLQDWLTKQIHRGMGVVDDVITKEGTVGSYSRSNISRQMFLMLALRRARRIAHAFDQAVCRPLIKRNGLPGTYKIEVKIPGMEEEDPNGGGVGGGGGFGSPEDDEGGGEGSEDGQGKEGSKSSNAEEMGPLAKLFQQAMGKGKAGGASGKEGPTPSDGKEMSLSQFLSDWRANADNLNAEADAETDHGEE